MAIVQFPLVFRYKFSEPASYFFLWAVGGKIPLTSWEGIMVAERHKEIFSAESRLHFIYYCNECICCLLLAEVSFIVWCAVPSPKEVVVTLSFYFLQAVLQSDQREIAVILIISGSTPLAGCDRTLASFSLLPTAERQSTISLGTLFVL